MFDFKSGKVIKTNDRDVAKRLKNFPNVSIVKRSQLPNEYIDIVFVDKAEQLRQEREYDRKCMAETADHVDYDEDGNIISLSGNLDKLDSEEK